MSDQTVHIPIVHTHAIRMSDRQYGFLRYMRDAPRNGIGLEELSHFNQLTVGSARRQTLTHNPWINENPERNGIVLTHDGKEALKAFEAGDFMRGVARMTFSSFLSLDVYDKQKKSRPHRVKQRAKPPSNVREFTNARRQKIA
jgi:hypothetical protein